MTVKPILTEPNKVKLPGSLEHEDKIININIVIREKKFFIFQI